MEDTEITRSLDLGAQKWRPEVCKMADAMEAQLQANDYRGGWKSMKPGELHQRIEFNLNDLGNCRARKDRTAYLRTCADIANFAMMLMDIGFTLS